MYLLCRSMSRYVRYSARQISTSSFHFVRQNISVRRETDFLQPTSKISSPSAVCVLKNYFISFGSVEQTNVGNGIQVVEYHLNGDINSRLIFTLAELRELYESVKSQYITLMEGRGPFSTIEKHVEKTTMRIWEDSESGLRVLRISHSTPLYNNLRPLVIPIFNLDEFLNQLYSVLMNGN